MTVPVEQVVAFLDALRRRLDEVEADVLDAIERDDELDAASADRLRQVIESVRRDVRREGSVMTREATQRRRQAVETVHDVVSAMRAIAAGRIQGASGPWKAPGATTRSSCARWRPCPTATSPPAGPDRRPTTPCS